MIATDSLPFPETILAPDFSIEENWIGQGKRSIAGVDEVGRGPLAGPVVAAAVVLDPHNIPTGLNDSKKLNAARREKLFGEILISSHVAWCSLPPIIIDNINIREAALRAMEVSVTRLPLLADCALIDGRDVPNALTSIGSTYVKGDGRSVSIAAASIIAKVVRDRMMVKAHEIYPTYGFANHKGYGSKMHRNAIAKHGPCPLHRKSFSPVRQMLEKNR